MQVFASGMSHCPRMPPTKGHKCAIWRVSPLDRNCVCPSQKVMNMQFVAFPRQTGPAYATHKMSQIHKSFTKNVMETSLSWNVSFYPVTSWNLSASQAPLKIACFVDREIAGPSRGGGPPYYRGGGGGSAVTIRKSDSAIFWKSQMTYVQTLNFFQVDRVIKFSLYVPKVMFKKNWPLQLTPTKRRKSVEWPQVQDSRYSLFEKRQNMSSFSPLGVSKLQVAKNSIHCF